MVVFSSRAVSNKLFTAFFGRLSKSVLTKCDNCFKLKRKIPHLLRPKVDYRCVKSIVASSTAFSFRGKVGYPTFHTFFFCLFTIFIHISPVFSRKIINLHGDKSLSGTFAFCWNF